jgi:hypothetical protein
MAVKFNRNVVPTMYKRRRRLFGLLMVPIGVLAWCIGWSLLWIGETKEKLRPMLVQQKGNLTFSALLPEPKLKLRNQGCTAEAPKNPSS